jgi:RecB family exonuclease
MATAKKVIPIKPLTSWSFSRYQDYKSCPAKAKYKHIDKLKEPPSPAMERGAAIHNLCEQYVKGTLAKLPPELKLFKDEFTKLRKMYKAKKLPMIVEDNWAFTNTWEESTWNDWVNCWVRIKLDCAHYEEANVLYVTDYKTGKMNDFKNAEYMEQLELYALAALLMSAVEDVTVVPRLLYLDSGDVYPPPGQEVTYTRADLKKLLTEWNKRVKPMMTDTRFAPKPSANSCRWCYFSASKNGPCQF